MQTLFGHGLVLQGEVFRQDFVEQQTAQSGLAGLAAERQADLALQADFALIERHQGFFYARESDRVLGRLAGTLVRQVVTAEDDVLLDVQNR